MFKKFLAILICVLTVLSLVSVTSYADEDISVVVNGLKQDYSALSIDENTLVPMDKFLSSLNAQYSFDEETGKADIKLDEVSLSFVLDTKEAELNGKKMLLPVAPMKKDGTVMIPARFTAESLGYKVTWIQNDRSVVVLDKQYVTEDGLLRTLPANDGEKAVILRADLLTGLTFTPIKDIPTYITSKQKGVFEAGKEYKGIPYSSVEYNDKFIGSNVSLETFLSALANPDSVLYTKDLYHSSNSSTYYGMVCNGFVRYCLGIRERYSTQVWYSVPGMTKIADRKKYSVDDIRLCDVLQAFGEGKNHVAIITDILRDESGKIIKVEVSESVRTTCKSRLFDADTFCDKWEKYNLYRYDHLEEVPPFDEEEYELVYENEDIRKTPRVAIDYGNKSNYMEGEKTLISVFAEGENTLQIFKEDNLIEEIELTGPAKIEREFTRGYHKVMLKGDDTYAEFYVCKLDISHTMDKGFITIKASSGDDRCKLMYMDFRWTGKDIAGIAHVEYLSQDEKNTGIITRPVIYDSWGYKPANYKLYFENEYGIISHRMINIENPDK